jgi:mannose-6-phosphate isomerase
MTERRPWGSYTILEEREAYKVKRIEVLPAKRLSYQRHQKRDEHWVIVEGEAVVTVDGKEIPLSAGGSVDIPRMAAHRILNPGESLLVFIEVQKGDYFGEDDIIRLEDDFGRAQHQGKRNQ